jgi:predicted enzyme related to lactoylglutathione lyase
MAAVTLNDIGHIAVPVTDIDRAVAFYRDTRLPDHELWMAFFRDPDRNLLALMSEVRPEAASDHG